MTAESAVDSNSRLQNNPAAWCCWRWWQRIRSWTVECCECCLVLGAHVYILAAVPGCRFYGNFCQQLTELACAACAPGKLLFVPSLRQCRPPGLNQCVPYLMCMCCITQYRRIAAGRVSRNSRHDGAHMCCSGVTLSLGQGTDALLCPIATFLSPVVQCCCSEAFSCACRCAAQAIFLLQGGQSHTCLQRCFLVASLYRRRSQFSGYEFREAFTCHGVHTCTCTAAAAAAAGCCHFSCWHAFDPKDSAIELKHGSTACYADVTYVCCGGS